MPQIYIEDSESALGKITPSHLRPELSFVSFAFATIACLFAGVAYYAHVAHTHWGSVLFDVAHDIALIIALIVLPASAVMSLLSLTLSHRILHIVLAVMGLAISVFGIWVLWLAGI